MGFAKSATKSIFRIGAAARQSLRRLSLRWLRKALDRADELLHAQEVKLREEAARPALLAEVDPAASRKRELALKEIAGVSAAGCSSVPVTRDKTTGARPRLSAVRMGPRRQTPRLKYQHGEFVRSEVR
jgi:hypothetical protein